MSDDVQGKAILRAEKDKRWLERYKADFIVNASPFDSITRKGGRFIQSISISSYTPPPHATMLTGLYPQRHGVISFGHPLYHVITTLPEILKNRYWKISIWSEHLTLEMLKITRGIDNIVESFRD